jgi:hypothetical protein
MKREVTLPHGIAVGLSRPERFGNYARCTSSRYWI